MSLLRLKKNYYFEQFIISCKMLQLCTQQIITGAWDSRHTNVINQNIT